MEKVTLGSALLAGDEQSRSQVNSILLGLIGSAATTSHDPSAGETRRSRSGSKRSRSQHTKKSGSKRRRKEPRDHHQTNTATATTRHDHDHDHEAEPNSPSRRTVSLVGRVDRNKSAGSRRHANASARSGTSRRYATRIDERVAEDELCTRECIELEGAEEAEEIEEEEEEEEESIVQEERWAPVDLVRRTASSEEIAIPMLAMADVYDYFDYHYYPHSATTTPLPSPHLAERSTPSSPFPGFASSPRSSIQLPSSFTYAGAMPPASSATGPASSVPPVTAVPLALSLSSFAMPYPYTHYYHPQQPQLLPQLQDDSTWALPSRPALPTLDYCAQLFM